MRADIILADQGQVSNGKAFLLGAGWSVIRGAALTQMSVAVFTEIDWNETNQQLTWTLQLVDQDGKIVTVGSGEQQRPIRMSSTLEAGRPAGHPAGVPVTPAPMVVNLNLQLPAGRYIWQFLVDDRPLAERGFFKLDRTQGQQPPS